MGTNIYLNWNGKTQTDTEKQREVPFMIDAGNAGYLRASIHMTRENAVLKLLFREEYWKGNGSEDEYDFAEMYKWLDVVAVHYLKCVQKKRPLALSLKGKKIKEMPMPRKGPFIEKLEKATSTKASISQINDMSTAITWLNSLFGFFELGMEKQKQGLKPYPFIVW